MLTTRYLRIYLTFRFLCLVYCAPIPRQTDFNLNVPFGDLFNLPSLPLGGLGGLLSGLGSSEEGRGTTINLPFTDFGLPFPGLFGGGSSGQATNQRPSTAAEGGSLPESNNHGASAGKSTNQGGVVEKMSVINTPLSRFRLPFSSVSQSRQQLPRAVETQLQTAREKDQQKGIDTPSGPGLGTLLTDPTSFLQGLFQGQPAGFSAPVRKEVDSDEPLELKDMFTGGAEFLQGNLHTAGDTRGPIKTREELPATNKLAMPFSVMQFPASILEMPLSKITMPFSHLGTSTLGNLGMTNLGQGLSGTLPGLAGNLPGPSPLDDRTMDSLPSVDPVHQSKIPARKRKSNKNDEYEYYYEYEEGDHEELNAAEQYAASVALPDGLDFRSFSMPYSFLNTPLGYFNLPLSYVNLPYGSFNLPLGHINFPMAFINPSLTDLHQSVQELYTEEETDQYVEYYDYEEKASESDGPPETYDGEGTETGSEPVKHKSSDGRSEIGRRVKIASVLVPKVPTPPKINFTTPKPILIDMDEVRQNLSKVTDGAAELLAPFLGKLRPSSGNQTEEKPRIESGRDAMAYADRMIEEIVEATSGSDAEINSTIEQDGDRSIERDKKLLNSFGKLLRDFVPSIVEMGGLVSTDVSIMTTQFSLFNLPFGFNDMPLAYVNLPLAHFNTPLSHLTLPFSGFALPTDDFVGPRDPTIPWEDVNVELSDMPPSLLEALNEKNPLQSYLNLPLAEMNLPISVLDMPFTVFDMPFAFMNLPFSHLSSPFTHLHLPFEVSGDPLDSIGLPFQNVPGYFVD